MPGIEVGKVVAPVHVFGPTIIAPRLENPEGSLQRTIGIQHHNVQDKVNATDRSLFRDGTPRIGAFNRYSYPDMALVEEQ
eukprot:12352961-Alexandrium_andersonii.AAC.1